MISVFAFAPALQSTSEYCFDAQAISQPGGGPLLPGAAMTKGLKPDRHELIPLVRILKQRGLKGTHQIRCEFQSNTRIAKLCSVIRNLGKYESAITARSFHHV